MLIRSCVAAVASNYDEPKGLRAARSVGSPEVSGQDAYAFSRASALCAVRDSLTEPLTQLKFVRRKSCALIATMTVLADIRIAPTAGESTMPRLASNPAASGMATMLYPAAHQRF